MVNDLYAFWASFGFAFLYNIRGRRLFYTAVGGAFCQFIFDMTTIYGVPMNFLLATIALSLYAEIMARITYDPVMVYLIVGILPIVPGAGVYRTMLALFEGDAAAFQVDGRYTVLATGAIAVAILMVSSIIRIFKLRNLQYINPQRYLKKGDKSGRRIP